MRDLENDHTEPDGIRDIPHTPASILAAYNIMAQCPLEAGPLRVEGIYKVKGTTMYAGSIYYGSFIVSQVIS